MPPELTGADLRAWRRGHGMPTRVAAQLLGCSSSHVVMMECGWRRVTSDMADRVRAVVVPPPLAAAELRAWRLAHGWMVKEVGRALGCAYTYITNQERGHSPITWSTRCYVAAHPAPAVPVRVLTDGQLRRQSILAALYDGPGTALDLCERLPYRLAHTTITEHLRVLVREGRVVRWWVRGRAVYRATLQALVRERAG